MNKLILCLPIICLTSCGGGGEELSTALTTLMTSCNEVGDTLIVETHATTWNKGIIVTCTTVGDKPKEQREE